VHWEQSGGELDQDGRLAAVGALVGDGVWDTKHQFSAPLLAPRSREICESPWRAMFIGRWNCTSAASWATEAARDLGWGSWLAFAATLTGSQVKRAHFRTGRPLIGQPSATFTSRDPLEVYSLSSTSRAGDTGAGSQCAQHHPLT
jgi:hypothetical protein